MKGKLKHWNEDKGFGFISSKEEAKDIFIHISSLKKMTRRPIIGDTITFQIHLDNNGKKRATNAQIEGVASVVLRSKAYKKESKYSNRWLLNNIILALIIFTGYGVYKNYLNNSPSLNTQPSVFIQHKESANRTNYSCKGKTYCSEMRSCKEATFYINNCSGTKMDGDNDGVPCESQWCN